MLFQRIFKKIILILSIILMNFTVIGCANLDETGAAEPDYNTTKKMMVDMLQTEEGKNAIQEVLQEDDVKEEMIMEQDFIEDTIHRTLASDQGKDYWEEVMKDPEFSKIFAANLQEEHEKLLKKLMKDPEYQGMMVNILKDPELEKNYVDLMKSKNYRTQVMSVVTEAMESPLFVARVNELLEQIAKQELQRVDEEEEEDDDEENDEENNDRNNDDDDLS